MFPAVSQLIMKCIVPILKVCLIDDQHLKLVLCLLFKTLIESLNRMKKGKKEGEREKREEEEVEENKEERKKIRKIRKEKEKRRKSKFAYAL